MFALFLLLFIFVGLNALGYMHARAFTHYSAPDADKLRPGNVSTKDKLRLLFLGVSEPRPENEYKPWFWTRYTVHKYPSTGGNELEAWYIPTKGAEAVVVLFHGYGEAKDSVLREAAAFRSLGYGTFLVDFRGSGGSTGSVTTVGYNEADDVAASVDYVRKLEPGKPIIVYGSSMGAVAILRAVAVKGVKPAACVLECPFDTLLHTVRNRFRMMHVPSFPGADFLVFWAGVQFGFSGFKHNPTDYAEQVHVPVLLIGGDEDKRVTVPQLKSVYDRLAGPKQLEIFEGIGHGGYVKNEGRKWRNLVADFLKKRVTTQPEAVAPHRQPSRNTTSAIANR